MEFVAKITKDAVKRKKPIIKTLAAEAGCSEPTAHRWLTQCRKAGYLEGVVIKAGQNGSNTPLESVAKELNVDVELLRTAIINAGGRVSVGRPKAQKDMR